VWATCTLESLNSGKGKNANHLCGRNSTVSHLDGQPKAQYVMLLVERKHVIREHAFRRDGVLTHPRRIEFGIRTKNRGIGAQSPQTGKHEVGHRGGNS